MANSLVVRRRSEAARVETVGLAAQYVRMSTDYQRYSIENQAVVIAAYAQAHNLRIVRTYADKGESGLKLRNRLGLIELLDYVQSGHAEFGHILVFDVSRWGRFQDIDESAHYEFICKRAGIKVAYCAEQFDNDGSLISNIVKNLKRVMAAEYSRELSAKVHAGQCRFASLGFMLGGNVGYALRRELVDAKLQSKGILRNGDRKYLLTDHVRVRPGPPEEVAVVRWIFQEFNRRKSETAIARELNRRAIPTHTGSPWNRPLIGRILRDEHYVGNLVFNKRSNKLREAQVYNPPDLWVRSEGCIEPIIDRDVFLQAKKTIEERRVDLPEEEMLARLRRTLFKEGRLSPAIINRTVGLPCTATYMQHFGSLRNVYRLIGYASKKNCDYIDSREAWAVRLAKLASQVAASIKKRGRSGALADSPDCIRVSGTASISFRIARWYPGKKENHSPLWSIQYRAGLAPGWVAAIRLGEHNDTVLDYLLLPTTGLARRCIKFSEKARPRHGVSRFGTAEALIRSISRRVTTNGHAPAAKPARVKMSRKAGRPKGKSGRARH